MYSYIGTMFTFFLQEVLTEDKGRGVFADRIFQRGDFVCCYKGELISKAEGERRRTEFKEELGSFIFFFKHNGKDLWFVADYNYQWL